MNRINPTSYKLQATHPSRGFTLFYALLVTSLLLALGLAVFNITLKELMLSSDARESQNAFFAADAALECALFWDRGTTPAFGFYGDSLASGIRSIWPFDEGTGDTVYDYGRLVNNHGTLVGASFGEGHTGDGIIFDGVSYIDLDSETTVPDGSDFTVSAWIQPNFGALTNQFVFSGLPTWASPSGFGLRLGYRYQAPVFQYIVQVDGGTSGGPIDVNVDSFKDGVYHHFVWRREGTTVELLVDGSSVGTFTNRNGVLVIGEMGRNIANAGAYFYGGLDDVRVYNRALSDEEISLLAQGRSNPTFAGPYPEDSSISCAGMDISSSDPLQAPGLTTWVTETSAESATTTFDIGFSNGRCALVEVAKDTSTTTIVSRGYNTCLLNDSRRVERALRAVY